MTLEQLRIFVAVAEGLHMTRAAEALNITQSAASAAVSALETRHAARLFDRVGRGLALTEAGDVFLPEAKAVLARARSATQALEDLAGLKRGRVTMFASQTIATYWLPPRLAQFARAHPGVELDLRVGNTAQVAQAVLDGDAELGFVEGAVDAHRLEIRQVGADRLALVAAPDHPLASRRGIGAPDLAAHAWVRREPGSGTRSEFEQVLRGRGVDPETLPCALVLPSNEAILAAVAAGDLLAAVSELAARPMIAAGLLRPLAFDLPPRPFDLVSHRERRRSRAAAALVASL